MRESSAGSPLCYLRLQRTLRFRLIFCVMSLMAQGAHRGRPVAAAPCTPGLRPATSPLRGAFDLSLQASGRAEAASVQNTALSPHPCGLPRPFGNVSAMLRPPASAVSAAPCPAAIHILGLDPVGRVSVAPPGKITAQQGCLEGNQCLPAALRLRGPGGEPTGGPRRPWNALSRYLGSWTRPGYPTGRIRRRARLSPAPRRPA